MTKIRFGIDIGGTGIKGGLVDVDTGQMASERIKMKTPQPATPLAVSKMCSGLIRRFDYQGNVGVGFPAIIKDQICLSATNMDQAWVGAHVGELLTNEIHLPVHVINDADAAALCELKSGAAYDEKGLVMLITIGTGIGCGMISDGRLVPNCELGVTYLSNGIMLEKHCSNVARKQEQLDWDTFGDRLNDGLSHIVRLTSPNLIVLGGGVSKNFDLFGHRLDLGVEVKIAQFKNDAGTIGAALAIGD